MKTLLLSLLIALSLAPALSGKELVVLLHGLARTADSMEKMEASLNENGYETLNIDYPSRKHTVEALCKIIRARIVAASKPTDTIHFVTHSMGGIIVRYTQKEIPLPNIGRVVMLSPPNNGSELVNELGDYGAFEWLNGPAGMQLGIEADGFIASLGPVEFELGVITGDRSINWMNSIMIPGDDDGKVSTESAEVEGMAEFKIEHTSHPYIMKNDQVIEDTLRFLKTGSFEEEIVIEDD